MRHNHDAVEVAQRGHEIANILLILKNNLLPPLRMELRKEGRITTLGAPFQASDKQEIDSLIARGVFKFKKYDPTKFNEVYIFKSRMVNKIKGKATNALFKKLRLII